MSSRFECRNLPIASPLDWLCCVVDDLACSPTAPDTTRYLRLPESLCRGAGGRAMLATVTTRRIFDDLGRLREVRPLPQTTRRAPYSRALGRRAAADARM